MNSAVKKMLLYIPASALGVWCALLQNRILTSGFDGKDLLVWDIPELKLLWGIVGVYLLAVLGLVSLLGGSGTYEENFPPCYLSGAVMASAGLMMGFSGLNRLVPGMILPAALTMAVGVMMILCGLLRMLGKNPTGWPDLLIGVYYAWWMLTSYSGWNANPHVQRYAFQLLAGVAVLLFTIHRARMAAVRMERRRLVFYGFAGIVLSFAAIPGAESVMFFLSSGLWCAGGMCDLKRIEP